MRLIDADPLPRHGQRGGLVHWKDIENAPTIDIEERLNDAYAHGWSDAEAKYHDAVEVVRCKECKWYDPPHILYKDGTRKNVEKDELTVTADVGINCGGKCMAHGKTYCTNHDREDPEDEPNIVIFRNPMDYCSYGERRTDE